MEISALIPIAAFAIPYLVSRQMISSAVARLNDSERLALFPIGRTRQLLMWLTLPVIAGFYFASTPLAMGLSLVAAIAFIIGVEIFQLLRVRSLSIAPAFKRTHLIATVIACSGVLFAAAAFLLEVYAP